MFILRLTFYINEYQFITFLVFINVKLHTFNYITHNPKRYATNKSNSLNPTVNQIIVIPSQSIHKYSFRIYIFQLLVVKCYNKRMQYQSRASC